MKIGLIVEGSPGGTDERIYGYLAKRLRTDIEVEAVALGNKPRLIERCGEAAKMLLEIDNCEKVIIIWDHYPAWRRQGQKPCLVEDSSLIRDSLGTSTISERQLQQIQLVCMEQELETLLLADARAIRRYLESLKSGFCRVNLRHPEHYRDPKEPLNALFYHSLHCGYHDWLDAEKIIVQADIRKLWRCSSFVRFADKVAGVKRQV